MKQRNLAPPTKRADIRVDAIFDIESQGWDQFVALGLLDCTRERRFYRSFDVRSPSGERDAVDALLKLKGTVWAHNGGGFDFLWLCDRLIERAIPAEIIAAGGRMISLQLTGRGKGERLMFADSAQLSRSTLQEFASHNRTHKKAPHGLACIGPDLCGVAKERERRLVTGELPVPVCRGYCAIRVEGMTPAEWAQLHEYLENDCFALDEALTRLRRFAGGAADLDLGITLGSSAWKHARRMLELPEARRDRDGLAAYRIAREGTYGGRVEIFRPEVAEGHHIDLNLAYPHGLDRAALPWGDSHRVYGRFAVEAFAKQRPGIYRASVKVPRQNVQPLPWRDLKRGRIYYPHGRLAGTWALPELEHAVSRGAEVEVWEAEVWDEARSGIFAPWLAKLHKLGLRAEAHGFKDLVKQYRNALCGKLGARAEMDRYCISEGPWERCRCVDLGFDTMPGECAGACGALGPTPIRGLAVRKSWAVQPCAHQAWAAYLCAEARIAWYEQAVSVEDGADLIYCATDSLLTLRPRTEKLHPNKVGYWKTKGEIKDVRILAPNRMRATWEHGTELALAGTSLSEEDIANPDATWDRVVAGQFVTAPEPAGFLSGVRAGGPLWATRGPQEVAAHPSWGGKTSNPDWPEEALIPPLCLGEQLAGSGD